MRFSHFGAGHCVDIPFAFDVLSAPGVTTSLGESAPQALADAVHGAWVKFVSSGAPGWPAYDLARRTTMVFDEHTRVESDPLRFERAAWAGS